MSPSPPSIAELLQPTLATMAPAAPLLSPRATFFASFFGGPWAAVAVGTVNLVRLRRARRDGWVIAAAALIAVLGSTFTALAAARPELVSELVPSSSLARRVDNLLGIAAWGLFYLRLRPELRAVEVTGEFANPWRVAVPAVVGAMLLDVAVALAAAVVR